MLFCYNIQGMRGAYKILLNTFILSCVINSHAWGSVPFSKYGNIQTVQNYSSNPFWTPDSPYNLRMPTPVYATGPEISLAQCRQVVTALISNQCKLLNNCVSATVSDIRPAIMLQLSRIPTGNYATACGGYIDVLFTEYTKNRTPVITTGGQGTTAPTPSKHRALTNQVSIPTHTPEWAADSTQRAAELKSLRQETGDPIEHDVVFTDFPTTYSDFSIEEQRMNRAQGYTPYKESHAYQPIQINIAKKPEPKLKILDLTKCQ